MGIRGSVLSIFTQLLSNRPQHVMVDGCRSKLVNVVSGVSQGSVFGPLLFLLNTSELFSVLKIKLISYESTLLSILCHPKGLVTLAENRDLGKVSEWCDLLGIKLNASKTKTMIVSRSLTIHPQTILTISGTVLQESVDLDILGVTFDLKMTLEASSVSFQRSSQRLGILRKYWRVFHDRLLIGRCFRGLSYQFWTTVLHCGARLQILTLNYWTVLSVVPFFHWGCV